MHIEPLICNTHTCKRMPWRQSPDIHMWTTRGTGRYGIFLPSQGATGLRYHVKYASTQAIIFAARFLPFSAVCKDEPYSTYRCASNTYCTTPRAAAEHCHRGGVVQPYYLYSCSRMALYWIALDCIARTKNIAEQSKKHFYRKHRSVREAALHVKSSP
jgi:hypothetical protein